VVPDVAVSGTGSGLGMVDGLLGVMLRKQHVPGIAEQAPAPAKKS
jgi:hypothetical protein